MKRSFLIEVICGLLILLFAYTAISKLTNFKNFTAVLSTSPLIGSKAHFISWLLPAIELMAAICLFFPKTRLTGLTGSFILMLIFTFYVSYMLISPSDLPCSCGGVLKQMTWRQHLTFNIAFAVLAFAGILIKTKINKQRLK